MPWHQFKKEPRSKWTQTVIALNRENAQYRTVPRMPLLRIQTASYWRLQLYWQSAGQLCVVLHPPEFREEGRKLPKCEEPIKEKTPKNISVTEYWLCCTTCWEEQLATVGAEECLSTDYSLGRLLEEPMNKTHLLRQTLARTAKLLMTNTDALHCHCQCNDIASAMT